MGLNRMRVLLLRTFRDANEPHIADICRCKQITEVAHLSARPCHSCVAMCVFYSAIVHSSRDQSELRISGSKNKSGGDAMQRGLLGSSTKQ